MARGQVDQLDTPAIEEGVAIDEKGVRSLARQSCEGRIISRLLLAWRTWICSPMARAAVSASLTVSWQPTQHFGLTSTRHASSTGYQLPAAIPAVSLSILH